MDLPWDDVQLVLVIAEKGSLSRAAKRLRVGQPTMSRRLAVLEYRLGYPLFLRQAAGVALTSAGERLVEPAKRMAEWAGEVARAAGRGESGGPRGLVRVTAPPGVAFDFVAPFAAVVRKKHPDLRLEVLSSVHVLDLARGEADLALRLRPSVSRELVVVASLVVPNAVVVSRSYATKLPKRPRIRTSTGSRGPRRSSPSPPTPSWPRSSRIFARCSPPTTTSSSGAPARPVSAP